MKYKVFRPHIDDVERLSYGKAATKRGTGSRHTCHRLNAEERKLWELAKHNGYLTIRGTGYRRERKGSPLHNIYRQRCDALEQICVIIEKRTNEDTVVIDFSTLRVMNDTPFVSFIMDNVFQAKYPELKVEDTVADTCRRTLSRRGSLAAPIDVDAIKMKPIWGVEERLISVACTRDVAKAVAMDILEVSGNFDLSGADQTFDEKTIETSAQNIHNEAAGAAGSKDNYIDWNDI